MFEGESSHRLYSLIAQGRPFERVVEHPLIVEVLDRVLLPNWLLSNCQSIRLYPGESHQPCTAHRASATSMGGGPVFLWR